ncbi:MAG: metallophosphoesterase family protein [Bacteroidota bacterium]
MKIGILSDTHGFLPEAVFRHFEEVDEIWHGGDIGSIEVLDKLRSFKPTLAVWGNIDDQRIQQECREVIETEREKVKILITHIAGKPPRYNRTILDRIRNYKPKILVCGHSHMLKVMPDEANKLLYVNPGAAGRHGFHSMKTILRLDINDGVIENLRVIELGTRGKK